MCDEYLTGPALHRAIADAMENGECPDVFRKFNRIDKDWSEFGAWPDIVRADEFGKTIRRKPRMRHLTTQDGQRWEWPEPMHHVSKGERYWSTFEKLRNRPSSIIWSDSGDDLMRLANGFCHRTIDAVEQHARALIAASGGSSE